MSPRIVGLAIAVAAEIAASTRRAPGDTALDVLDRICGPYRGARVDFQVMEDLDQLDDSDNPLPPAHPGLVNYAYPVTTVALGMLLLEAFSPGGVTAQPRYAAMLDPNAEEERGDADIALWEREVLEPFQARYGFKECALSAV